MASYKISPHARIGAVQLRVHSLDDSVKFYEDIIGLHVHHKSNTSATLGSASRVLLHLDASAHWLPKQRGVGLYHVAFLLPSRQHLGAALRHLMKKAVRLQGAADHFVSEALYLADPEGNGLEIYADRPRDQWAYLPNGQIRIGTVELDVDDLWSNADAQPYHRVPDDTIMGHVHLHAAAQAETLRFYQDVIGMDEVSSYPPFHFLSAGGYHHHVALQPAMAAPKPRQAGLAWYELTFPDYASLDAAATVLNKQGIDAQLNASTVIVQDPSQHTIRMVIAQS